MKQKNPYKRGGMFEGALHTVFEHAKHNRNNMTAAEAVLWLHLREGIKGYKFRRQHPIGMYIADFYCHKAKLVIEVDGSIHDEEAIKKADEEKESFLTNAGYTVLRFTNNQVLHDIANVLSKIKLAVNQNFNNQSPNTGD